jgi:hypothetical protein
VAVLRKLQLPAITVSTTALADGVAVVARRSAPRLNAGARLTDILRDFSVS